MKVLGFQWLGLALAMIDKEHVRLALAVSGEIKSVRLGILPGKPRTLEFNLNSGMIQMFAWL